MTRIAIFILKCTKQYKKYGKTFVYIELANSRTTQPTTINNAKNDI